MSGNEFRLRLRQLGRTQAEFARELGCSLRSVSRWSSEGPPSEISYLLDLLETLELHVGRRNAEHEIDLRDGRINAALNRLFSNAISVEHQRVVIQSVRDWLEGCEAKADPT